MIERAVSAQTLTNAFILELHDILLKGIVRGKLKGHYREAQNIIRDSKTQELIYLPPEWKEVKKLMRELISWTNLSLYEGKSPLVVAALFHYHFITVHPFMDGNGRLARLLSNFILFSYGYNALYYASLEKQHEKKRALYYRSLRKVQAPTFYEIPKTKELTSWVQYWLTCLQATYKEALSRTEKIENRGSLTLTPRLQLALNLFKKHKKFKAVEYQSIVGIARTQAVADLQELIKQDLIKKTGGGRSTVYQVKE